MSENGAQGRSVLDDALSGALGSFNWLKSVLLGEFSDNTSQSALVASMLANFIPGVVVVTSARDAVAVILRLAQHPEKREDLTEWIMLSGCMITVALPLAMAAGGAAAAGVGAIVGGIAGSQLAAALRAVMLLLIKEAGTLADMLKFLQKFMRGDLLRFLYSIKFAKYEKPLLLAFDQTTGKLIEACKVMRTSLERVNNFDRAKRAIAILVEWEKKFYAVQHAALRQVPRAMAELDARLLKVVAQVAPKEVHIVMVGVRAEKPLAPVIKVQYVHDVIGQPLLHAGAGNKAAGQHGNVGAQSRGASGGSAPGSNGAGGKPPRKLKADKIEKVAEGPNTKRQETLEVDAHVDVDPLQKNPDFIATSNGDVGAASGLGPRKLTALQRELKVVEMTGGRSATTSRIGGDGKLIIEDTPIFKDGQIVSGIDVFGENGELIQVGGPGKNANDVVFARTKNALENLKDEAQLRGTTAQVYYEQGGSERFKDLISESRKILGKDNVFIFEK